MAEHQIAAGMVSAPAAKLTASTEEIFKFAQYVPVIEIITDGSAAAYVTIDGSVPTVGGANCYTLPALACVRRIPWGGNRTEPPVVKVISSGTPTITVSRSDPAALLVAL